MSAYRRLNRASRPFTLQASSYPLLSNGQFSDTADESSGHWAAGKRCSSDDETAAIATMFVNGSGASSCLSHNNNHSATAADESHSSQISAGGALAPGAPSVAYVPQPKHIRFPDVPYQSELLNELMIFTYTIIAAAMQFLHLYRTVWWLPESNTDQAMVSMAAQNPYRFAGIELHLFFAELLFDRRTFDDIHCGAAVAAVRLLLPDEITGAVLLEAHFPVGAANSKV